MINNSGDFYFEYAILFALHFKKKMFKIVQQLLVKIYIIYKKKLNKLPKFKFKV